MRDEREFHGPDSELYKLELYRLLMFKEFQDVDRIVTLCERVTAFRSTYVGCSIVNATRECESNIKAYKAILYLNIKSLEELGPNCSYTLFSNLRYAIREYDDSCTEVGLKIGIGAAIDELNRLCESNAIAQFFDEWSTRSSQAVMKNNVM